MKVNESSLIIQSTKFYTNFTTYERADENEPYMAAVFNSSYFKEDSANFTLGTLIRLIIWITHICYFEVSSSKR